MLEMPAEGRPVESYSFIKSATKARIIISFTLSKSSCAFGTPAHVSDPVLDNTDKETEAGVIWTVSNQPDVRARSGREELHHDTEVAEIRAIRRRVRIANPHNCRRHKLGRRHCHALANPLVQIGWVEQDRHLSIHELLLLVIQQLTYNLRLYETKLPRDVLKGDIQELGPLGQCLVQRPIYSRVSQSSSSSSALRSIKAWISSS